MKKKAIIVDIDGTLANSSHRKDLAIQKRWDEFTQQSVTDEPYQWALDIVNMAFSKGWTVLIVTGRTISYYSLTITWLMNKCGFTPDMDFILFMRKNDDSREDTIVKKEIYNHNIKDDFDVQFVLEDRTRVVKMWRKQGLICLQCDDGNF